MKRVPVCAILLFTAAAMIVSGCSKEDDIELTSGVAARVGDAKITKHEVDLRFDRLNQSQQKDFEGARGQAQFVDMLIEEQLVYGAAKQAGLHRDPDVALQIALAEKSILLAEYFRKVVLPEVEVSDEEVETYYREHIEEFTTRALIRAQHLFTTDRGKAEEWVRRLQNGERFEKIAKSESEDETTALVGGNLGYFNPGGYVKSIGYSETWTQAVEKLEEGEISDVISFEKGYSVVKLNEKTPSRVQDLSEVRKRIVDQLGERKGRELFRRELDDLKRSTEIVNYAREKYMKTLRSAKELWEAAQLENDTLRRIQLYRDIVNAYPADEYAPQALFMIGFTYAEELNDHVNARRTLEELIGAYPDSDMIESARWLIDNLQKPHPAFESVDEMREAMEKNETTE